MSKLEREERLQRRFLFARAFVSGELNFETAAEEVARGLSISVKTLRRDVARARRHQRYDEWRPARPGPKPGQHRTAPAAGRLIEQATYEAANQKLNRAKQARDARHDLVNAGLDRADIPSHSTIERRMAEIEARDRSFFAIQRHGRDGKWGLEVQEGALEVERPLQVVQMDHQRFDHLCLASDQNGYEILRPWVTAGVDVYTGACLTAILIAGTPSSATVALAVALMGVSKTAMISALDIPGTWEEGGISEVLHVDRAKEFKAQAIEVGAKRYGTKVYLERPYAPWRKGYIERF